MLGDESLRPPCFRLPDLTHGAHSKLPKPVNLPTVRALLFIEGEDASSLVEKKGSIIVAEIHTPPFRRSTSTPSRSSPSSLSPRTCNPSPPPSTSNSWDTRAPYERSRRTRPDSGSPQVRTFQYLGLPASVKPTVSEVGTSIEPCLLTVARVGLR